LGSFEDFQNLLTEFGKEVGTLKFFASPLQLTQQGWRLAELNCRNFSNAASFSLDFLTVLRSISYPFLTWESGM
jgi:hypothetical protein